MRKAAIVDCGPLLAFLDRSESRHFQAVTTLGDLELPLYTVESVLSELAFLMRRRGRPMAHVGEIVASGMVEVVPVFPDDTDRVAALMQRYANVPMSLADAALVRLSEKYPHAPIFTFDSDFDIYRRNQNEVLPLLPLRGSVQESAAVPYAAAKNSLSTEKS